MDGNDLQSSSDIRLQNQFISIAEYLKFAQCDANITKDEKKCGSVFRRVLQISQEQPTPPPTIPLSKVELYSLKFSDI